jgi:hypothetical protein
MIRLPINPLDARLADELAAAIKRLPFADYRTRDGEGGFGHLIQPGDYLRLVLFIDRIMVNLGEPPTRRARQHEPEATGVDNVIRFPTRPE